MSVYCLLWLLPSVSVAHLGLEDVTKHDCDNGDLASMLQVGIGYRSPCVESEAAIGTRQDRIALAQQAYIYGFPLTEVYKARELSLDYAKINQLYRFRIEDINCHFTLVVTPNVDTAYTSAYLDLTLEPMVVTVPKFPEDYYWMIQFMDAFTDVFAVAGADITNSSRTFVVTGPMFTREDYCGTGTISDLCTENVPWYSSTSNLVWMLARYLDGTDVSDYQQATYLTSISKYDPEDVEDSDGIDSNYPPYDDSDAVAYYKTLNTALQEFENLTARPQDIGMLANLARAGIGTHETLAMVNEGEKPESLMAISNLLQTGLRRGNVTVVLSVDTLLPSIEGWRVGPSCTGNYSNDYLCRAMTAEFGFGANPIQYAVYPAAFQDESGLPLNGARPWNYKITFATPPPRQRVGFWSLTAYWLINKTLACNDYSGTGEARYSISSETELQKEGDSFTLYLQAERPSSPAKYQNWLPVPRGLFYVILRIYNPAEDWQSIWPIPPIKRIL